jgi:hypothetical protein
MKSYEIPTMNISVFAVENIVTESAVAQARAAVTEALGSEATVKEVSIDGWTEIN